MDDLRQTLDQLNQAWIKGRFEELGAFFDADIVTKGPALKEIARGRAALVQSYVDFMGRSKLIEYAESDHAVYEWGDTAAVSYTWTMSWEQAGKTSSGSGQDMFVFARRGEKWLAVLRLILF